MKPLGQRRIAAIQHVACEPPAAYGPALEKVATVETFLLGRDEMPVLADYDAAIVMGGPMGVYDTAAHPWLRAEIESIAGALDANVPVWGVCLGAQLIAAAAGAVVGPGPIPEVGVSTVQLTEAARRDTVFGAFDGELTVLQWHGDTFELPDGAVLLASSAAYPNQAFRIGRSYAVQFHLEAPLDLAEEWLALPEYRDSLQRACGAAGEAGLREGLAREQPALLCNAELLITRWLNLLD